ncbi:P-loop containing nucleoside triphosphate hydrolase protein [Dioscorea alata]|uniref:P-loop containing nucleoside triphosphate hydrolase protein n=1 Tax=Dioscorea alata TaxID=55571 RepID=A0ACB7UYQ2_DIOAL|nr:P-loop containing nucleoside triphosphate hydrolase protein [Dioscorea alata]
MGALDTIPAIQETLSYIFTSTSTLLDYVENELEDLKAKENDVRHTQEEASRTGKQLTHQAQRWLNKVRLQERQDIVNQLKVAYNNRGYLLGSCSLNLWANYKINQSSIKLYKEINNLKMEHDAFKEIAEAQPPKAVLEIATSVSLVGNTIKLNLEKIRGYLVDDDVSMTTLLNEINNSLLGGDINMGFKLGLPSDSGKSDIFDFLKKKDFLLLLDDIWKRMDLPEDLGISLPLCQSQNSKNRGQRYKHNVIFTTRDDDVCAHMITHKKIKVECLNGEQAWHLFKQHTNEEIINSNAIIKQLARKVTKKCLGLPLALKVIGRATSNMKTPEEWRHMLRSLIKMDVRTITGIEKSLFHNLKISYDNLASETLRECFLCCAYERIPVPDLIEHWIGFALISDFGNIGEAFDEGYSLIAKLNEACLLELDSGSEEDYVKLHDVIRDMALWIVSECGKKKNKWIVCGSDDDLRQFSKWEAATSPRYPNLQSLFMNCCYVMFNPRPEVVINIFPHMPSLTHLNLSGTPITVLSKDIRVLVNLQYLNISKTEILSLPSELKELKELKYFLFRSIYFGGQKVDGLATISMLPKFQVLDLFKNTCLEASDLGLLMDRNRIKAISLDVDSVEILGLLKHLPTWKISLSKIQNMHILQLCDLSFKHGEGLMALDIYNCGFEELLINGSEVNLKHFYLFALEKLKQITWPAETLPSECFPRLTSLSICCCFSLRSLSWVLHLPCLRRLEAEGCSSMEELIDPADQMLQASSGLPTFPSLLSLRLWGMLNLESFSTCPLDFPVLSELDLLDCPKLKKLPFKSSIVNNKFREVTSSTDLWESLEWEDTIIRSHLTKFLRVIYY